MGKKRKSKKLWKKTRDQVRREQEQLLKAHTIQSAKIYKRKDKHPRKDES